MAEMFDRLPAKNAPFIGSEETIGHAFRHAAKAAPAPGALCVDRDEPSTIAVAYHDIPNPGVHIAVGTRQPDTLWEYETLARNKGRMLQPGIRD